MPRILDRLDALLTFIVGRRCPGCGEPCTREPCSSCVDALRRVPGTAGAAWLDDGVPGRLVRAAKLGHWRAGGRVLARAIVALRAESVPPCDVVTWIPADRRRRAERGGHLPERVARALGHQLGVPSIAVLEPVAARRPQRGLDRTARTANVAGAFRVVRRLPPGTCVLVIDDVRTTGATLLAARAAFGDPCIRVETFAIVGVDRAISGPGGVPKDARSEEIRLRNRTTRADESVTLRKGSSLLAPRPP